jgi:hypothetical protein
MRRHRFVLKSRNLNRSGGRSDHGEGLTDLRSAKWDSWWDSKWIPGGEVRDDDQAGATDRHILRNHAFSTGNFAPDRPGRRERPGNRRLTVRSLTISQQRAMRDQRAMSANAAP